MEGFADSIFFKLDLRQNKYIDKFKVNSHLVNKIFILLLSVILKLIINVIKNGVDYLVSIIYD